jgi:hypothetical protein
MKVDDLIGLLKGVKRTSRGWSAHCPAHGDKSPSFSIREGEHGRILLHCFAGCTFDAVCAALGIPKSYLFASGSGDAIDMRRRIQHRQRRMQLQNEARYLDGLQREIFREAEHVILAGSPIETSGITVQEVERLFAAVIDAHDAVRKDMGEEAYAEWSSRLGTGNRQIAIGER